MKSINLKLKQLQLNQVFHFLLFIESLKKCLKVSFQIIIIIIKKKLCVPALIQMKVDNFHYFVDCHHSWPSAEALAESAWGYSAVDKKIIPLTGLKLPF